MRQITALFAVIGVVLKKIKPEWFRLRLLVMKGGQKAENGKLRGNFLTLFEWYYTILNLSSLNESPLTVW